MTNQTITTPTPISIPRDYEITPTESALTVDVMFPPAAAAQDESQFADEVTPTSMSGAVMEQVGTPMPNLIRAIPHIVVSGESGVGKTHFTRTANDGFCLDIEDGAGSEFDDDHKVSFNPGDPELAIKVMRDVVKMKSYKRDGQYLITPKGIRVRYLVVDTMDILMKNAVEQYTSRGKTVGYGDNARSAGQVQGLAAGNYNATRMELQDWGAINSLMGPLVTAILSIGIPVVFVTHEGGQKAQYHLNTGKMRKPGDLRMGVSGQTGDLIQNLVHAVVFIMFDPFKGKRVVLTKAQLYDDRRVYSKDRHNIFPVAQMDYEYDSQFLETYFSYFCW